MRPRCCQEGTYLHGHREVILSFWRKKDVHSLLLEGLVSSGGSSYFDDVQFSALRASDREAKERGLVGVAFHLKLDKSGCVTLNRLAYFPLHGVELHSTDDAVLLGGDSDEKEPILGGVAPIVDDLTAVKAGMSVENLLGR